MKIVYETDPLRTVVFIVIFPSAKLFSRLNSKNFVKFTEREKSETRNILQCPDIDFLSENNLPKRSIFLKFCYFFAYFVPAR